MKKLTTTIKTNNEKAAVEELGLVEAKVVKKDGKEVVEATDKEGKKNIFEIIKDEVGKRVVKITGLAAPVLVSISILLNACVSPGRVPYNSADEVNRNFNNTNKNRIERTIQRADAAVGDVNDAIYGVTAADMFAAGDWRMEDLLRGRMSSAEVEALVPADVPNRKYIIGQLTGDGLSPGEAAALVKGDITRDVTNIDNMAASVISQIDRYLGVQSSNSKQALMETLMQRVNDGENISRETYQKVSLIALQEHLMAFQFAFQEERERTKAEGIGLGGKNETLIKLNAYLKQTGLGTMYGLKFADNELIDKFIRDIQKTQPPGVAAQFLQNFQVREDFAKNPTNTDIIEAAKQANGHLASGFASFYGIGNPNTPQLMSNILLLSQLVEKTVHNVFEIQKLYPQFRGLDNIRASAPVEHTSGGGGGSTQDSGRTPGESGGGTAPEGEGKTGVEHGTPLP